MTAPRKPLVLGWFSERDGDAVAWIPWRVSLVMLLASVPGGAALWLISPTLAITFLGCISPFWFLVERLHVSRDGTRVTDLVLFVPLRRRTYSPGPFFVGDGFPADDDAIRPVADEHDEGFGAAVGERNLRPLNEWLNDQVARIQHTAPTVGGSSP